MRGDLRNMSDAIDKKYVSLNRLTSYDSLIKEEIVKGDSEVTSYINSEINKIKDGTTVVANATDAVNASKATKDASNNIITSTYETKTDATAKLESAKSYTDGKIDAEVENRNAVINTAKNSAISTAATDATTKSDAALASAKTYTNDKVSGLASTIVVDNKISAHDTSNSAHNDIRDLITELTTKLNNFLDVDETTTDQLSEVLELIENNKGTLDSLTTSKVNVSDIVDDLTTANAKKVLSANQGVAIKALIDALTEVVEDKSDESHTHDDRYYTETEINTKVDIINQSINGKQDKLTFDSTPTSNSTKPVTSGGVYTALSGKQATITGGATTITSSNLTASRALVSNSSGKVAVSDVTSTELGYLDGVTSNVQEQLNEKADADSYLPLAGGIVTGSITFDNSTTSQKSEPYLQWGTHSSNKPYIGFAHDQSDGTFIICSMEKDTTTYGAKYYKNGLSIGGGSGNLFWKGEKVATAADLELKANLASPTFTGTPKAPTASAGTNTAQIATTAFVTTEITNAIDAITDTIGDIGTLLDAI